MRTFTALAAASALAISATAAVAQNSGLVVVDLANADVNLLNNIANDLHVNVSDIQALNNVSIPVGLAAAVCGVNANVLAHQKSDASYSCPAKNSTAALQKAVQQKLHSNTHQ